MSMSHEQIRANIAANLRTAAVRPLAHKPVIGARALVKADATEINEKARTVTVIASTDAIDLYHSVVVPAGADLTYIMQNRKVFVDHRRDTEYCVGAIRDPGDGRGFHKVMRGGQHVGWQVTIGLKRNALADNVWNDINDTEGAGIGVSIGFESLDEGPPTKDELARYAPNGERLDFVVRRWAWVELSFTHFPANVECQQVGSAPAVRAAEPPKIIIRPEIMRIIAED